MEVLKVNKFGRTYHTGTQEAQAIVVRSYYYFFNLYVNVQLVKRDIVTTIMYYYVTAKSHYAKRGPGYGDVSYKFVWGKTFIDILAEILMFL